jgi:parallel beta-helix repeat protein
VSLETPLSSLTNEPTLINTTITNLGWETETNIDVQLWINDSLVTTQNYPTLLVNTSETLTYEWIPINLGTYNITAFVVPATNEAHVKNNINSTMTSIYRFLPHAPIWITSDAQMNATFPGKGTIDDPIRIERLEIIDSNNRLIYIRDTTFYFSIADNILNGLSSGWQGIYLQNVMHGTIANNTIFSCGQGIEFSSSSNNIIVGNTIHSNAYDGIRLFPSSDYNTITNNTVYSNSECGFSLYFADNNIISNNTVHNNNWNGFDIGSSNYNTIANNTIFLNNQNGIQIGSSNNNNIHNNTINDNNESGIFLDFADNNVIIHNILYNNYFAEIGLSSSSYNTVSNNTISNNRGAGGIYIVTYSNNNTIINNTLFNNFDGIVLEEEANYNILANNMLYDNNRAFSMQYSSYNTIKYNDIHENQGGIAIIDGNNLGLSKDNLVYQNIIYGNQEQGIILHSLSVHNYILNNYFIDNNQGGSQAYDDGSNNAFIFNYWNDLSSPDINSDGIVDFSYMIDGSVSNSDPYPLVSPNPPPHLLLGLEITHPESGYLLKGTVSIQWTAVSDTWGHQVSYSVYYSSDAGTNWILLETDLLATSYAWDTTTVSDGSNYLIKVVVTCSEGFSTEVISELFTIQNIETTSSTSSAPASTTSETIATLAEGSPGWRILPLFLSLIIIVAFNKRKKKR